MPRFIVLSLIALISVSCTEPDYATRDKELLRSQFHLPDEVQFPPTFNSPDKANPFFGREGLSLNTELQLDEKTYLKYVESFGNTDIWKPVAYPNYMPSIANEWAPNAFEWRPLPLPAKVLGLLEKRIGKLASPPNVKGSYLCSVVVYRQIHPDKSFPYTWRGKTCEDLAENEQAAILNFGMLDEFSKKLHLAILFSG